MCVGAMIITAAEQQTMNYYMNVTNFAMSDAGRSLYEEIALVEEEHVTQYEDLMDPRSSWLEMLLWHEYSECYLYWSCYMTETDRCIRELWEQNFLIEVSHLHKAAELLKQDEPEAKEIALAIELFTSGSLNTFAKHTNVDTNNRLICYDILDLGKQLMPIGMLVVLDSILNRITQNRAKGRNTFIFIDEIYLLFQHEYSANFLFTLWKRVRKYGAYATGITQNVDDLLQSHTARTMLANSEFIIMLNQASTDRLELAKLLNISDLQMSYITNVEAGHGLIKVGSSLVPFANKFPKNTKLYKLMTTKPGESA